MNQKTELVIFESQNSDIKLEVNVENETVWLSQNQMTQLFDTTKQNISLHLNNIFKEIYLEFEKVNKWFLKVGRNECCLQICSVV